jgi:hypothetical protein
MADLPERPMAKPSYVSIFFVLLWNSAFAFDIHNPPSGATDESEDTRSGLLVFQDRIN